MDEEVSFHQPAENSETTVFKKKTRDERRQELHHLLTMPEGLDLLTHIYKTRFRLPPEGAVLPSKFMIARILSIEYPEG
jgi:hypothetical protein